MSISILIIGVFLKFYPRNILRNRKRAQANKLCSAHGVSQFRDKLFGIAAEEEGYIRWLAEHITALDGQILQVRFSPGLGKNSWERLPTVLEKRSATVQTE